MRPLDATADLAVSGIARAVRGLALRPAGELLLSDVRARAADRVLERHASRAALLAAGLRAGEADAREALAALAEVALRDMRAEVQMEAERRGRVRGLVALLDARWARTDETEYLDDPALDRERRVALLDHLDALNTTLGNYRAFYDALRPSLRDDGAPTRVLDLAAGHGGFLLEVARLARRDGTPLELTASDLKREYLELGETRARREGLDVRFVVQDALDLSRLAKGAYDVIVCTQSLHHFPAGLVAVMASEASRVASRAVVLVDGARSAQNGALIPALGLARYRDAWFAHDAYVSTRRFFAPEELGLLARLGPEGHRATARWLPPGHCLAVIDTAR